MNNWVLEYNKWNSKESPLQETLCTQGNGIFATRGALEELPANEFNYPGTYLACGFNRAVSKIKDKDITNEDLVNWPNWLPLSIKTDNSDWLDINKVKVLEFVRSLDLRDGLLERKMRFEDKKGQVTTIITKRIVSMADPNMAGIEWEIIPENWEGELQIRAGLDGSVINAGVERYGDLTSKHLKVNDLGEFSENGIYLTCETLQSKIRMAQAATLKIFNGKKEQPTAINFTKNKESVWQEVSVNCAKMEPVKVEKMVAIYTSRDFAISDPLTEAKNKVQEISSFNQAYKKHQIAWKQIWARNNFNLETSDNDILILRLHLFHLHQTVSQNSIGYDIGIPSRGWHGEAYRGHIFWDELYIFPYLNLHMPQLARSLLLYRYRRLPEAQKAAKKQGYRGAMFPWQSGSNGREESQKIHLNPKSGRWIPDNSNLQRHINAAIPYNVWQYYQSTSDIEFLRRYGAEIILNTALFWLSISEYNTKTDRFEIQGVMGPDEYHTKYPDSDAPGLKNNAYTNFMALWVMNCALQIIDMFDEKFVSELSDKTGFTDDDIKKWKEIAGKMFIPINDKKIIMQFEGYENLKELDWKKYEKKYGEQMRLDRILEKENDSPNNYMASKQADVLMLFYLFSSNELCETLNQLGYDFKPEDIPKNIEYYQKRTSHGSTLSQVIHSWVYARSDRKRSWSNFKKALLSDIKDVQGGTTPEGIHLGAMAGTVDLVQRCYTGIEIRNDKLWLNPRLPKEVKEITLNLRYRSHWIKLKINQEKVYIDFEKGWANPVTIRVRNKEKSFKTNESASFKLKK